MKGEKFDAYREREKFDALVRESPLNLNPDGDIRQHRIGKRATEWLTADPDRRRVLENEMFAIHEAKRADMERERKAMEKANRKRGKPEPVERGPMHQLCVDLLEASSERARLKVAPPDALRSVPNFPDENLGLTSGTLRALRMSLDQSREDCDAAKRAASNGDDR